MREQLHIALHNHLHQQTEQFRNNKDKLDELYSCYDESAFRTLNALHDFAELLYWHGINEDDGGQHNINTHTLISVGTLLKNNLSILDLSLSAKDKIGDRLYALALGK